MRILLSLLLCLTVLLFYGCGSKLVVIKSRPAEENHKQVLETNKVNTVASGNHLVQAKKMYAKGKYKQAMKHCEKAISFNHRNWEAHYYLGLVMQKRREYTVSIESFGVSLKYCPKDKFVKSELHYSIGFSWEQLGRGGNASKAYALALEFNPANKEAGKAKNRVKVDKTMKNWGKKKNKKFDG